MKVDYLKAFSDNYMWIIELDESFAIVDPGDAKPVHEYIDRTGYWLSDILITHHHWDHTGGLEELIDKYKCPAYGPSGGHIKGVNYPLKDQECFNVLESLKFRSIYAPGHTNDQLSYFLEESESPILFSGDTLFSGGCGRLFEGTPEDMLFSMDRYAKLPKNTLVYCGHEYTQSNLNFALAVEPNNKHLQKKVEEVKELRKNDEPSLPTQLETELKINPFLRCREETVIKAAEVYSAKPLSTTSEVLGEIRDWKDNF